MSNDLRARMRAVFAGKLANGGKGTLTRYNVDSAKETSRYIGTSVTPELASQIKTVTRARASSANKKSQGENTCAVCGVGGDLWHLDTPTGSVLVHEQCAKFVPVGAGTAAPTMAYRATSAEPDGTGCKVEIVELPTAGRYRKVFGVLQARPPAHVPEDRWRQCVRDGRRFLARWGEQAQALNWSSADLFGLHTPPEQPHPSYTRLSRYDARGLCWLLQGREVIALTATSAAIMNTSGAVTMWLRTWPVNQTPPISR
jgi:hypothetical protein